MIQLIVWAVIVLLVVLLSRRDASNKRMKDLADKIPGPRSFPIIGSSYLFLGITSMQGFFKRFLEIGKGDGLIKLWLGSKLLVLCKDSNQIAKFLLGQKAVNKIFAYSFIKDPYPGVFSSNGKRWQELRGMLNQTLRQNMLDEYLTAFNEKALTYSRHLEKYSGALVDPLHDTANVLFDLALYTHWGVKTNELEENEGSLSKYADRFFVMMFKRSLVPFLQFDAIYKWHPDYHELESLGKQTILFLKKQVIQRKQLIEKEKDMIEGDPRKRKNVYMDMLMDWAASEGKDDADIHAANGFDLLVAAADTTSVTLCQVFYHLAVDPEIQRKVQDEIDDIFNDDPKRPVTKRDLNAMKYTEMVLKEVLRLYCPPNTTRTVTEDVQTDHGVVPAGTILITPLYLVHKDPRFWEKPEEFYPEHFLPDAVAQRPKTAYIPFMAGPRSCPGKHYAYWVVKVFMAHVLRRYRIETNMKKNVELKFITMVSPKDGYALRFVPRTTTA